MDARDRGEGTRNNVCREGWRLHVARTGEDGLTDT